MEWRIKKIIADKAFLFGCWNLAITLITLYLCIIIPFNLALNIWSDRLFIPDTIYITILYSIDIIIDRRYFQDNFDPLYSNRSLKLPFYCRPPFILDLIAAIPFGVFFHPFWQILRLVKIFKVRRILERWRIQKIGFSDSLTFWYLLLAMTLITHWISCGWLVIRGYDGNLPPMSNYIDALYWSITTLTTVGYGDITPVTDGEKIYVMCCMLVGLGFFGFLIGNITSALSQKDPAREHYLENIEKLSQLVRYRNLSPSLQKKVFQYYNYKWKKRLGFDETEFLETLPNSLKNQVALQLKKEILEEIPLFKNAHESFIKAIAIHLKPMVMTPDDYVFRVGEWGKEMYFIIHGQVKVLDKDGATVLGELSDGDFFGEIALFQNKARTASIQAMTYCDLYVLPKTAFTEVVTKYPYFGAKIEEKVRSRMDSIE